MFVKNKSIIESFLTSNHYKSSLINTTFSSEKVVLSESREKYAVIKHNVQVKTVKGKLP